MNPHALDQLVTAAARSIVEREPHVTLRTSVLARIEPQREKKRTWLLAPAAVAAVAALVVGLRLDPVELPVVRRAPFPTVGLPEAPAAPVVAARAGSSGQVVRPPRPAPLRTEAAASLSEAEAAWLASAPPALPTPEPTTVSVSQPEAVTIALLEVPALVAEPLLVPPLGLQRVPREP